MRVIRHISTMQRLSLAWKRAGRRIALVPTMGYLHAGHLSLVERARKAAGRRGKVVVSIYVNPTQFAPTEDLSRYPRDLRRDLKLCRGSGVDVVFAPDNAEVYSNVPGAEFSTYVQEEKISRRMEGASRPTHFRGVGTIVAKLFNIVLPDSAVFGAKDYQQAAVVQRMVRDLNFPLRIVVAPTVRELDGLAMSSRNKYLEGPLRSHALVLSRAIQRARDAVNIHSRRRTPLRSSRLKSDLGRFIGKVPSARLDYVEFFDPKTLVPVSRVKTGVHMALAVFIGRTRLIDNAHL
jgi:pantoate--beta-alanine ligase